MNAIRFLQVAIVCSGSFTYAFPRVCYDYPFQYITRQEWGADPPRSVTRLSTPVPYVIIHHTYIPAICMTADRCKQDMKSMQRTHQVTNGWADIGYNFAVGGEGSVLEGRGWETQGAHAAGWNARSIGIVLIGNFVSARPTDVQIRAAQDLIKVGVDLGFIAHNYMLIGHRQAVATECPGNALFNEIKTWSNFVNNV